VNKPTKQLVEYLKSALALLPDGETLGELSASNNVLVEKYLFSKRGSPKRGIRIGLMNVSLSTYTVDGTRRDYVLLARGKSHKLQMVQELSPELWL
jgi:hypothetical protein